MTAASEGATRPGTGAGCSKEGGQCVCRLSKTGLQEGPEDHCPVLSSCDTRLEVNENDQEVTTQLFSFSIDTNECFYDELNACSGRELCLNVEGSYQCLCHPESPTSSPQRLNHTCEGKRVGSPRWHRNGLRNFPGQRVHRDPLFLQRGYHWLMGRQESFSSFEHP